MEKSSRPVRNRRHNRRVWPPGDTHRPVKRLFTPEIKRMLKDWLVRRRDNPYPSRDEKKALAFETGLTYIQICNWFANWRRKLKNSGKEPTKKTWGHLIKNYNTNAKGNVEQFSICSNDSIWIEDDRSQSNKSNSPTYSGNYDDDDNTRVKECVTCNNNTKLTTTNINCKIHSTNDKNCYQNQNESAIDHYYTSKIVTQAQCFHISSTTDDQNSLSIFNNDEEAFKNRNHPFITSNAKYKHQMMEKYLRDSNSSKSSCTSSPELSKWLESAAKFTPNKNNYFIEWNANKNLKSEKKQPKAVNDLPGCANFYLNSMHQKEELDAAEALANLACNYRQRMSTF